MPDHGARPGQGALVVAVQHRAAGQHDCRDVDRGRPHHHRRRGLVAAGRQHHAVQRVAVQHLHQAEIGQVAVQRRRRPLAGFLDRVDREFQRHAARVADAFLHPDGQIDQMAVARRQVAAGLGDADDRAARLQFLAGQPEIEIALQVERGHARIVGVVEPFWLRSVRSGVSVIVPAVLVVLPLAGPSGSSCHGVAQAQALSPTCPDLAFRPRIVRRPGGRHEPANAAAPHDTAAGFRDADGRTGDPGRKPTRRGSTRRASRRGRGPGCSDRLCRPRAQRQSCLSHRFRSALRRSASDPGAGPRRRRCCWATRCSAMPISARSS